MAHYEPGKALRSYHNVRMMLKNVPRDLWHIFLPVSADDIAALERNILAFKTREIDREKVITIQKMCGFPLRPNAPLREMLTKVRIQDKKKEKGGSENGDDTERSKGSDESQS
jgi:hypothetical protein